MQIFVYLEPSDEGINSFTRQILSGIRKIAPELREKLGAIVIGKHLDAKESILNGLFDTLIKVDDPSGIGTFNTEVIAKILVDIIREKGPALLFLGNTHQGMELAPAVGWQLQVPVVTNCVGLSWTAGTTAQIQRPIQGGKMIISLDVNLNRGAVFSIQKGAWSDEVAPDAGESNVSVISVPWKKTYEPDKTEVIEIIEEETEGQEDITSAQILLSLGRGLGDPENIPVMQELAEKIGAVISCSRPVVDHGWLPGFRQVGISGKTVTPVIYFALGISGQANHVAGMDSSRIIIAVNNDPSAPIFNVAHYGVLDNIHEFVPELLEQLNRKL